MRFRTVVPVLVGLAFAGAVAPAASAKRLKSLTFCGPKECWSTPATMVDGEDVFATGHATTRPTIPVRYYRVQLQYSPTGQTNALFMPSLGTFRNDAGWWKVPRRTAEALRRFSHSLRAYGPRKF